SRAYAIPQSQPVSRSLPYTSIFRSPGTGDVPGTGRGSRAQAGTCAHRGPYPRLVALRGAGPLHPTRSTGPLQGAKADLVSAAVADRKSTRLYSSHVKISYALFCL